jgi:hypothetical protein
MTANRGAYVILSPAAVVAALLVAQTLAAVG